MINLAAYSLKGYTARSVTTATGCTILVACDSEWSVPRRPHQRRMAGIPSATDAVKLKSKIVGALSHAALRGRS